MVLRADFRRDFADQFLPRIAAAAEEAGFTASVSAGARRWEWVKHTSPTVRVEILLAEMTGRDVRDGLDIQAYGAIYLDEVEQRLRDNGERHPDAATLMASLRAWGSTFTRDSWYRLRWNTDAERQVEALIRDLHSFSAFATTIRDVSDLSAPRLARSRIRRHVASGLAPNFTTAEVATLIAQMNVTVEVTQERGTDGSACVVDSDQGVHFSDLGGFVLFSPVVMAREVEPVSGEDLAARLAADSAGEEVTDRGAAIPLTMDASCDCRIMCTVEAVDDPARMSQDVWPLRVEGGRIVVVTFGALRDWDPQAQPAGEVRVPDGWYAVHARVMADKDDADLVLTLTAVPTAVPVRRTAALDTRFAFDSTRRTPGRVSVWTGRFGDEDALDEYVRMRYPAEGPSWSPFRSESGLGWYDEDFAESVWLPPGRRTFTACSYGASFASSADADLLGRPGDDAAFLVYDLDARDLPVPDASIPLSLLGVYEYRR